MHACEQERKYSLENKVVVKKITTNDVISSYEPVKTDYAPRAY